MGSFHEALYRPGYPKLNEEQMVPARHVYHSQVETENWALVAAMRRGERIPSK
jgi:hypothetical protein